MAGVFTKAIKKLQDDFRALSYSQARETKDGDLVIPRHKPVRKGACPKCGKAHTINEHRFHGYESHIRTHGDESGIAVLTGGGSTKRGSAFKLPPFPEPEARRRAASKKAAPLPPEKPKKKASKKGK